MKKTAFEHVFEKKTQDEVDKSGIAGRALLPPQPTGRFCSEGEQTLPALP